MAVLAIFLLTIGTLLVLLGVLLVLVGTLLTAIGVALIYRGGLIAVGTFLLIRRLLGRDRTRSHFG